MFKSSSLNNTLNLIRLHDAKMINYSSIGGENIQLKPLPRGQVIRCLMSEVRCKMEQRTRGFTDQRIKNGLKSL